MEENNTLATKVLELQKKGWILLSQSSTTAQLRKPRPRFSCLPNIVFSTLAIVGVAVGADKEMSLLILVSTFAAFIPLFYLVQYVFAGERLMVLVLGQDGKITASTRKV